MRDRDKTKQQLINELNEMRQQISRLLESEEERKRAEEALKRAEQKWRSLTEYSPDHIMLLDLDGNIMFINRTVPDLTQKEVIGTSVFNYVPYEWHKVASDCFSRVIKNGKPDYYYTEYRTEDGEVRYFYVRVGPLLEAGKVIALISASSDITERKQAEEALRESEEKFRSLTEKSVVGTYIIQDSKMAYVNPSLAEMFGYEPEEIIGNMTPADLIHHDDIDIVMKRLGDRFEGKVEDKYTAYRAIKKDGSIIFIEVYTMLTDYQGKPAVMGTLIDITASRQAEEEHQLITKTALDGFWLNNLAGEFLEVNDSYCTMTGYTREELLRMSITDIEVIETPEMVTRHIDKIVEHGSDRFETQHRRKDGEIIDVEVSVNYLDVGEGQLFVFVRDITEHKQAEEALRESEERYRSIVEMSPDGIVTLNVYGIVTSCNAAFINLTGYPEDEILGKHIAELPVVRSSDIPVVTELFTSLLTLDNPETVEWQWTRKDGTQKVGEFRMGLIEEAGVTGGFQIVVRDVTGHRQMEEERRRIERLESVGTLAGGIAHDFNNLLTGIMGNISLVRGYLEPGGKAAERLLEAERASLRVRDLTQQLLTFARGGEPVKETTAIGRLVRDSANFALGGSRSTCAIDIPENLWQVHADKGQMNEVIHNLVINADEAMSGGGVISISARNRVLREGNPLPLPKGDYIEVSIKDHGVGIPEDNLARIYEPYFTTKEKGSGLGLATTYSIIKNHEGNITVDSIAGAGATFHVYLPATRKSSVSLEEKAEDIRASRTGKILVMDDEEVIRRLLQRALSEVRHDIALATDGDDAIEQYVGAREQGQPFDLVILDLTVPGGMGGMEAMEKLLAIDPDIKSIVSSGYSTDPIMADYRKYGFRDVIAKPYRVRELRRMIQDILQDRHG